MPDGGTLPTLPARQTWLERFPARDLNRRLPELKQARADGWELSVLVTGDSRWIVVAGWYAGRQRLEGIA